jgi:hypothetical protein
VLKNLPRDIDPTVADGWATNGESLARALRNALCPPEFKEPEIDFTICVDRSVRPSYPDWVEMVMHPELEGTGPAEYNLQRDVELWLHPKQKKGTVSGNDIHALLKESNTLADQLGLTDLVAIRDVGIVVFRELFKGKVVFGWKSVVQHRHGRLHVPYLYGRGDGVVLRWHWLGRVWRSSHPAVRFRNSLHFSPAFVAGEFCFVYFQVQ